VLLDAGADIDEETDEGITVLMAAARRADTEAVAYLVQRGANVNAQTVNGNTAVMFASDGRNEYSRDMTLIDRMAQCIDVLANAGADLDLANDSGATALHWATTGFSAEPVEMLLRHGANPRVRAQDGSTPLGNACAQDHQKMVEDLIAAGAADESGAR
jgi:ankyrin repeat protein